MAETTPPAREIRLLDGSDEAACRAIYRQAALCADAAAYSAIQRQVWAAFAEKPEFRDFALGGIAIGCRRGEALLGFASAEPHGYIKSLYVAPDHQRQGIGQALVRDILRRLAHLPEQSVVASSLSRGLFAAAGFVVSEVETGYYEGIAFRRFRMLRRAAAP